MIITMITMEQHDRLELLEKQLGYVFRQRGWLEQALIHSSYAYEYPQGGPSNERLEFLGDAVLNLIVSTLLLAAHPQADEGRLSRHRASLVNARHLARLARRLQLGSCLLLGRGEEQQAGRKKPSVLADALEAVVGAVYQDGGYEAAQEVVKNLFEGSCQAAEGDILSLDYKTSLQEYAQKVLRVSPEYHLLQAAGPAHAPSFEVEVRVAGASWGRGRGRSKKEASQAAARQALLTVQQPAAPTPSGQQPPEPFAD